MGGSGNSTRSPARSLLLAVRTGTRRRIRSTSRRSRLDPTMADAAILVNGIVIGVGVGVVIGSSNHNKTRRVRSCCNRWFAVTVNKIVSSFLTGFADDYYTPTTYRYIHHFYII